MSEILVSSSFDSSFPILIVFSSRYFSYETVDSAIKINITPRKVVQEGIVLKIKTSRTYRHKMSLLLAIEANPAGANLSDVHESW